MFRSILKMCFSGMLSVALMLVAGCLSDPAGPGDDNTNQEALLRLKASDKYPGEKAIAGPFIVTNLIGDYNNNRVIIR